jgi:hypothetical protein
MGKAAKINRALCNLIHKLGAGFGLRPFLCYNNGTEDIWWILDGQDYPRLWWEAKSIDD